MTFKIQLRCVLRVEKMIMRKQAINLLRIRGSFIWHFMMKGTDILAVIFISCDLCEWTFFQ